MKWKVIYFTNSLLFTLISLYLLNNNVIKYKVFNYSAEMKRETFINNILNNKFNEYYRCYPLSNCYEIINGKQTNNGRR
jgi:hypothetical protein